MRSLAMRSLVTHSPVTHSPDMHRLVTRSLIMHSLATHRRPRPRGTRHRQPTRQLPASLLPLVHHNHRLRRRVLRRHSSPGRQVATVLVSVPALPLDPPLEREPPSLLRCSVERPTQSTIVWRRKASARHPLRHSGRGRRRPRSRGLPHEPRKSRPNRLCCLRQSFHRCTRWPRHPRHRRRMQRHQRLRFRWRHRLRRCLPQHPRLLRLLRLQRLPHPRLPHPWRAFLPRKGFPRRHPALKRPTRHLRQSWRSQLPRSRCRKLLASPG